MKNSKNLSTNAIHAGYNPLDGKHATSVPLYLSNAYKFENADHAAGLFGLTEPGYIYTRLNNPTIEVLETRIAALDGGIAATAFASGTAALYSALVTLLKSGDHIVASNNLYGGTVTMLAARLPRLGIETTFVDAADPENIRKAIKGNTRIVFVEAVGNPSLDVVDIRAAADAAHEAGIPLMVDNTVPTSALLRPIEHGADLVLYSLTKFMGGQGTVMGGAIVDGGKFNWANGKFPELSEPNPSYHGLVYTDAVGPAAFAVKLRVEGLRDIGACLSPYNAFEIIQGLQTLEIRMKKHSENALELARWLAANPKIEWVSYPGLSAHSSHNLAKKYLPEGQSGLLAFGPKGGYESAKKVVDSLELISLVANLGDVKTISSHPASTTHQQLTEEQQRAAGVTPDMIRLSVGIEAIEDIKADIQQALDKI